MARIKNNSRTIRSASPAGVIPQGRMTTVPAAPPAAPVVTAADIATDRAAALLGVVDPTMTDNSRGASMVRPWSPRDRDAVHVALRAALVADITRGPSINAAGFVLDTTPHGADPALAVVAAVESARDALLGLVAAGMVEYSAALHAVACIPVDPENPAEPTPRELAACIVSAGPVLTADDGAAALTAATTPPRRRGISGNGARTRTAVVYDATRVMGQTFRTPQGNRIRVMRRGWVCDDGFTSPFSPVTRGGSYGPSAAVLHADGGTSINGWVHLKNAAGVTAASICRVN